MAENYISADDRAVRLLWHRIVAAHKAVTRPGIGEYGIGYLTGLRDGLSEAYATITGVSRQTVGNNARRESRKA